MPNRWRHLVGPENGGAPFHVSNAVHLHDIRLGAAVSAALLTFPGWMTYFYVYSGTVQVAGQVLGEGEAGLAMPPVEVSMQAVDDGLVVAFVLDSNAMVTREAASAMSLTAHLRELVTASLSPPSAATTCASAES